MGEINQSLYLLSFSSMDILKGRRHTHMPTSVHMMSDCSGLSGICQQTVRRTLTWRYAGYHLAELLMFNADLWS